MNWFDFTVSQAINTVLFIAKSDDSKGKYRQAILKIFRTIAQVMATDQEFAAVAKENFK